MESLSLSFAFSLLGTVVKDDKKAGRYIICGTIEKTDDNTLEITELPVREWTQDYKHFLEGW